MRQERDRFGIESSVLKGVIFDIQRFAIDDGSGIRTTVFLKGCPLRCLWCHNPEGMDKGPVIAWHEKYCTKCLKCVEACPKSAIKFLNGRLITDESLCDLCGTCVSVCPSKAREIIGRTVTVDELFAELEEDRVFYEESNGGITCSGGEPLMQAKFVTELFRKCKENGIHTALDTSGYGEWDTFEKVLRYTDLVLFDLKNMDRTKHMSITGVDPFKLWENFEKLAQKGIPIHIRCPVIPGCVDDEENFKKVAEFASRFNCVKKIELLPYHRMGEPKYKMLNWEYKMLGVEPPAVELIQRLNKVVGSVHPT